MDLFHLPPLIRRSISNMMGRQETIPRGDEGEQQQELSLPSRVPGRQSPTRPQLSPDPTLNDEIHPLHMISKSKSGFINEETEGFRVLKSPINSPDALRAAAAQAKSWKPPKAQQGQQTTRKGREIKLKDLKFAIDLADSLGDTYFQTKSLMRLTIKDNYRIDSMTNTKVFWTDEQGKIILWNEEMSRCMKIQKEKVMGKYLSEVVHSVYGDEIQQDLHSLVDKERPMDITVCFDVDNVIKRMILHGVPRRSSTGGVIGALFIAEEVMLNNFDRKHMRSGIGENFQRLLNGVNVKVFGVNAAGDIDVWNEKMTSATGKAAEDMIGKNLQMLNISEEMASLHGVIGEALKGKETFKYNYVHVDSDGIKHAFDMDITSRRDNRGNVIGALCVAQDSDAECAMASALQSAKTALEKAKEQLAREKIAAAEAAENESRANAILDLKRRFVRGVGHEIRTPLNVVFAGLQLLESRLDGIVEEDILEIIDDIKQSCRDAIDILDDLLSYEKLDSQLLQLEKSPLDIHSFVIESLRPFGMQAKLKNVTIRYYDTAPLPPGSAENSENYDEAGGDESNTLMVEADQHKLGQVLRNLISNAVKFSKPGGNIDVKVFPKLDSDESGVSEHGWLRIEVVDNGPGISKENQDKLFNNIVQFNPKELQNGGGR